MKRFLFFMVLVVVLFNFTGCQKNEPALTPLFTKDSYPRVDGSTVTLPLSIDMASELLQIDLSEAQNFIFHNKTHEAYVNLIDNKCDIIFVTEPSQDELTLAKAKGIELEIVPIVKDAFVFVANTKNPVESLTIQEVHGIYQGKITNWREVGGMAGDIIPYQRPANSGSQTLMENLVMKDLKLMDPPTELKPAGMGDLIEAIAGYDNSHRAIGYSVYYYANTMYNKDTMKFLGVNGVKPDNKSIKDDKYPYTISYYAVLRKSEAQDSSARKLLAWLLSKEGQQLAEKSGYVPLQ